MIEMLDAVFAVAAALALVGVVIVLFVRHMRHSEQRATLLAHESAAQLSAVVESAMDAIITIDSEQRIVLFNHAAEQVFRCPRDEALGGTVERIPLFKLSIFHDFFYFCKFSRWSCSFFPVYEHYTIVEIFSLVSTFRKVN